MSGCANLQTVNRSSDFPARSDKSNTGRAVHLDAQQRLLITSAKGFCAEPSPDALAAYASALGFGISNPSRNAVSLSNALSSNAGSIGLRTQSITLMRDALYRLCEAQQNGAINQLQMAHLITRSQDLTAVVLAIEQLTGAVVAPPLVLTPSPEASGTSALVANQELLGGARKVEQEAASAHQLASSERQKAESNRNQSTAALTARKAELNTLEGATARDEEAIAKKKIEVAAAETADQSARDTLTKAEAEEKRTEQSLADATRNRKAIEAARDSALASTRASVGGRGTFGAVQASTPINSKTAEKIANAVSGMVSAALNKNYIVENCMAFLLEPPPSEQAINAASPDTQRMLKQKRNLYEVCLTVVSDEATKALDEIRQAKK